MSQSAFVLRIAPSGNDRVPEALEKDQLIIGWADATGLLNEALEWEAFREIVHSAYHAAEPNYRNNFAETLDVILEGFDCRKV